MLGGEISGNTARNYGGGVHVGNGGTFRLSNGIIYGSNAAISVRNTADDGAALYSNSQTPNVSRGTFSGNNFNSLGSLSTTDETIHVVNGAPRN
jgi:hypothetical protein